MRLAGTAAEVTDADAWGCQSGQPPSLARFAVELDQRFLTELAHTTVLFNELFDQSGRKQLIKVPHISRHTPRTFCFISSWGMEITEATLTIAPRCRTAEIWPNSFSSLALRRTKI